MSASIYFTDLFCGAGGSSTGLMSIPGVKVIMAANHWKLAIETHAHNHPDTDHMCADISQTEPRMFPRTHGLWGSPECTNHSIAKGKKRVTNQPDLFGETIADEAADRSRATMWDMVRFAEYHHYEIMITENVVDARNWIFFEPWLKCFDNMGYNHHIVYMNSMHAQLGGMPAPQSRDRMYVVFWKKGNRRPDFDRLRPMAYCPSCDKTVRALQVFKKEPHWGRYRAQYAYRCPGKKCRFQIVEPAWLPASSAIDWSIPGTRIGDRPVKDYFKKGKFIGRGPLAPNTMERIRAGLERHGANARLSLDAVHGAPIITDVDNDVFATQTTAYTRSLLIPVEGRDGKKAMEVTDPLRTITSRNETGVLTANNSMIVEYYGNGGVQPLDESIPTITTTDRFAMITNLRGTSPAHLASSTDPVSDPLRTITAGGIHAGVAEWTNADIEDLLFRMLTPEEYMRGMAFPGTYEMLGNQREKVKLSGNAVCPPNARDLGIITVESLEGAA